MSERSIFSSTQPEMTDHELLDDLIDMTYRELEVSILSESDKGQYLGILALRLIERFERKGLTEDLNRAIAINEQAADCAPGDDPKRLIILSHLSNALRIRFERIGSMNDLNRGIGLMEEVVKCTAENHPARSGRLNNLAIALRRRFQRTGSMDDLNREITTIEQAIKCTSQSDPILVMIVSNLSNALLSRYETTASLDDLNRGIKIMEDVVECIPESHPVRFKFLHNLGSALGERSNRTGSIDDLDREIRTNEQAIECTPENHPDRSMCHCNLGTALGKRFNRTGSMEDLNLAIAANELAVECTPNDHPGYPGRLSNFGNMLHRRFERTGSMDDLNRAITTIEEASKRTPEDHQNRVMILNNLGIALRSRYERTGSMDDLNQGITVMAEVVQCSHESYSNRAIYLRNLGNALMSRFEETGTMADLNRAITTHQQAVECAPENHPDRAICLNDLGIALQRQFDKTESMEDLNRAISTIEQAVNSIPHDHPNRSQGLANLAIVLQSRFQRTRFMEDFDQAIMMAEEAVASRASPPSTRIRIAQWASLLLIDNADWHRANCFLQDAIELLPIASPRTLSELDQQFNISQFAGLTSRAVSVSLLCGNEPFRALRLSEVGNGILATLHLQVRSDIGSLRKSHPNLARQFCDLRDQLDHPQNKLMQHTENTDREHRWRLSSMFDDLLITIRHLQGFEQFLLAPSETDMKTLAKLGPIVVFNVSNIRCDAFIVTLDDIRSISLPLLTIEQLATYTKRFLNAVRNTSLKDAENARKDVHVVLEWLWDAALSPIIHELGCIESINRISTKKRVWWVGNGLLNILPIHAAGYHNKGSVRTVVDQVISSYTPTIKALAYSRERERHLRGANPESQKIMLVGMHETPGLDQGNLPGVAEEIDKLNELLSPRTFTTVIQKPTRQAVLSALQDHQIAHFSCHGDVSTTNPSESRLLLHDWKDAPLTVSDLTAMNIPVPHFAFLSACHTASSRNFRLLDEFINLSSALQLAGYPSVIGTLWRVDDQSSVELVNDVYSGMLVGNKVDPELAARSLHCAVCGLRERTRCVPGFARTTPDNPLIWAPYIHLGI